MNFKVYEVSYLTLAEELIESPFNLDWSRPEADLIQSNPSLKDFGITPRSEFK